MGLIKVKGVNISNIKVNFYLSPVYFFIIYQITKDIKMSLISTFIYAWSSRFFQPDLDQPINRPGMTTFPFGQFFYSIGPLSKLKPVFSPINLAWYYFWHPYGHLFTHRGVSHWPIIGTMTRVIYIYLFLLLITPIYDATTLKNWAMSFFPFSKFFGSKGFFLFSFPIYLSDFFHIAVDFVESKSKGNSFVPPMVQRGIFYRLFFGRKES